MKNILLSIISLILSVSSLGISYYTITHKSSNNSVTSLLPEIHRDTSPLKVSGQISSPVQLPDCSLDHIMTINGFQICKCKGLVEDNRCKSLK